MKIESKDFRCGNYFKWSIYASMGRDIDTVSIDNLKYSQFFEPIQLTEQILLKAGFKNDATDEGRHVGLSLFHCKEGDIFRKYNINCDLPMVLTKYDDGGFYLGYQSKIDIQYLHQLQNLYHSLSNKELEINL